jgi:hypothetical protein
MAKSEFAAAVDEIQTALTPWLRGLGFRKRARSFNRSSNDGLTHVVEFQMGRSEPPGTVAIPGFRESLYGSFTIHLGVHVPEVERRFGSSIDGAWIPEARCSVRQRLGPLIKEGADLWWAAKAEPAVIDDVRKGLESFGIPFLDRLGTRERMLGELPDHSGRNGTRYSPRMVIAIILLERGELDAARKMLRRYAQESQKPGHVERVRERAIEWGLGSLEDEE